MSQKEHKNRHLPANQPEPFWTAVRLHVTFSLVLPRLAWTLSSQAETASTVLGHISTHLPLIFLFNTFNLQTPAPSLHADAWLQALLGLNAGYHELGLNHLASHSSLQTLCV